MGKFPPAVYTDSEDESICITPKKKSKSLKERFRGRSKSEPEQCSARSGLRSTRSRRSSRSSGATSRSSSRSSTPARPLRGILKHTERERAYSLDEDEDDEDDEDNEDEPSEQSRSRCLVGRVPPREGRAGRGGGLAFVIRRNPTNILSSAVGRSMTNKSSFKRLTRKQSC